MKVSRVNLGKSGVTLIALVITIIVLLILAGITINIALGENGLLKRAEETKKLTNNAQNEEIGMLEQADKYIEGQGGIILPPNTEETEAGTFVKMPDNWYIQTPSYVSTPNGTEVKVQQK